MFDDRSALLSGCLRRFGLYVLAVGCAAQEWQSYRNIESEVWAGSQSILRRAVDFGSGDRLGGVCSQGRLGDSVSA